MSIQRMRSLCIIFLLSFCFSPSRAAPDFISNVEGVFNKLIGAVLPERCFPNLGCFKSGPPFYHLIWRSKSFLPQWSCNPIFLLYTPSNPNDAQKLHPDDDSVMKSNYDAELPIKILIHGFLYKIKKNGVLLKIKDELLKAEKCNVIIVNWEDSNGVPYEQAVANGRKVGAQIAYLLTVMKKTKGLKYEDVHLIGHSIGAHICGWTGERINKIGRITGLDPAGPYFEHAPPEVRLDETDASFVDVIHTDEGELVLGAFGIPERIGNVDFYPNGWKEQPACKNKSSGLGGAMNMGNVCQHIMSQHYFLTSINECRFLSVQCESYKQFQDGNCTKENSLVAQMGYHAKKIENIKGEPTFFLKTTAHSPYCEEEDRI